VSLSVDRLHPSLADIVTSLGRAEKTSMEQEEEVDDWLSWQEKRKWEGSGVWMTEWDGSG
jgi:hypothetical protein